MLYKLIASLIGFSLSFAAFGAGLGFNPFQKPVSPTSPGGGNQKSPPVTSPAPSTLPSKPSAPTSAPSAKLEKQAKK